MGKQRTHINAKHGGGHGQVQFVQHVRTRPKSQKQPTEGGGFCLFIVAIFLTSFIACTSRIVRENPRIETKSEKHEIQTGSSGTVPTAGHNRDHQKGK